MNKEITKEPEVTPVAAPVAPVDKAKKVAELSDYDKLVVAEAKRRADLRESLA